MYHHTPLLWSWGLMSGLHVHEANGLTNKHIPEPLGGVCEGVNVRVGVPEASRISHTSVLGWFQFVWGLYQVLGLKLTFVS